MASDPELPLWSVCFGPRIMKLAGVLSKIGGELPTPYGVKEAMAALVDLDTLSDELTNFKAASDALAEVTDESSPVKDIYPNKTSLTVISDSVQNIANAVFGHNVQAFVTAITDKLNEISELLKHPTLADVTDAVAALPKLDDTVCTRFKEVAGGQESVRLHKLCKDVE
eukprot:1495591-Pyramimonas_sp.AAC.1